jgi:hypothetical protein
MKQRQFDFQFIASSKMIGKFKDLKEATNLVSNLFTFNLPPVEIKHTHRLIIEFLEGGRIWVYTSQRTRLAYLYIQERI